MTSGTTGRSAGPLDLAHIRPASTPNRRSIVMVGNLPEPFGGLAQYCHHTCLELDSRGVDVHFLDTAPHRKKDLPPLASYRQVTGGYFRGALAALGSPRLVRSWATTVCPVVHRIGPRASIQALVLGHRVQAAARLAGTRSIVAHHAGTRSLAALVAARAIDARLTLIIHGAEWSHPNWNRSLSAVVAAGADRIIANSAYTRQLCMDATGRSDIAIIPPGVDHSRFRPLPRPEGHGEPTVLFLGEMHPRKGADVLAAAIPLLADVPARFVFAGPGGSLESTVRSLVDSSTVRERVEFLGQLSSEDVPLVLAGADIFVFPTTWGTEGFGMVAAEAMACGVPVVASRIGAIPEVVLDGQTGLLVEPGDPGDLASKLRRLLQDPLLRQRLGRDAAKLAQQYRWGPLAEDLVEDLGAQTTSSLAGAY